VGCRRASPHTSSPRTGRAARRPPRVARVRNLRRQSRIHASERDAIRWQRGLRRRRTWGRPRYASGRRGFGGRVGAYEARAQEERLPCLVRTAALPCSWWSCWSCWRRFFMNSARVMTLRAKLGEVDRRQAPVRRRRRSQNNACCLAPCAGLGRSALSEVANQ
jgi:hypothetical protein